MVKLLLPGPCLAGSRAPSLGFAAAVSGANHLVPSAVAGASCRKCRRMGALCLWGLWQYAHLSDCDVCVCVGLYACVWTE